MRLDKFLESRNFNKKACKRLFKEGKIYVDDALPLSLGANIDPYYQKIVVNHQELKGEKHLYLLLNKPKGVLYLLFNKPKGVVTANKDEKDVTVMDLIPEKWQETLRFTGRLDKNTEGLIFLTDNGQLNYRMHQDRFQVEKTYFVKTKEALEKEDILKVANGIIIDETTQLEPGKLEILTSHSAYLTITQGKFHQVTITQGKFHQVKKMFLSLGKKVIALKRVRIGQLTLPDDLKEGQWQELSAADFDKIREFFY